MVKFRFQRSSLEESLKTEVEVTSKKQIQNIISSECFFSSDIQEDSISIKHYAYHDKLRKEVFVVTVNGLGVVGWTDGEIE